MIGRILSKNPQNNTLKTTGGQCMEEKRTLKELNLIDDFLFTEAMKHQNTLSS
jgi:hypothetical protein